MKAAELIWRSNYDLLPYVQNVISDIKTKLYIPAGAWASALFRLDKKCPTEFVFYSVYCIAQDSISGLIVVNLNRCFT